MIGLLTTGNGEQGDNGARGDVAPEIPEMPDNPEIPDIPDNPMLRPMFALEELIPLFAPEPEDPSTSYYLFGSIPVSPIFSYFQEKEKLLAIFAALLQFVVGIFVLGILFSLEVEYLILDCVVVVVFAFITNRYRYYPRT